MQGIAQGDGCLIMVLTGWPSRPGGERVSHEAMHDVTTETFVPARVTERDGAAPGAVRVAVGVGPVSRASVVAVARHGAGVELTVEAEEAIGTSRAVVEALADDPVPHYGVSTGFGALANRHIPAGLRAELQRSLVRSHAAGIGPRGRAGGRPRHAAAAALDPGDRSDGRPARHRPRATPRCSRPGSRPSSRSTARWAARATWRRWRPARWR